MASIYLAFRAVFNRVSKVKTKTNPSLITRVFPRFKEDARSYFKFSLVNVDVELCSD